MPSCSSTKCALFSLSYVSTRPLIKNLEAFEATDDATPSAWARRSVGWKRLMSASGGCLMTGSIATTNEARLGCSNSAEKTPLVASAVATIAYACFFPRERIT